MAVLLALGSALSWGVSDFFGGLAESGTEDDRTAAIVLWTQGIGLIGLATLSLLIDGQLTARDAGLGAIGGLFGTMGVATLYRGLSRGTISVVAPITGVLAASLPVIVGVTFLGERPTLPAAVGIPVAIGSIVLVAREEPVAGTAAVNREALGYAVLAGIGFAGIFLALDATSSGAGLWPLVPLKAAGLVATTAWLLASGAPRSPARHTWRLVLGVGVLDNLANVAYLLATREGLLAIVAVLSSLYPAFTVLLARVVLGERLRRIQVVGMALAGAGVVAIARG